MLARTRIFVLALLALFATGIIVNSASATSMSLKMVLANASVADMADCQGCGTDSDSEESGPNCDIVCTISFAASLGQVDTFSPRVAEPATLQSANHLAGRTGPPEPYPPRTLI